MAARAEILKAVKTTLAALERRRAAKAARWWRQQYAEFRRWFKRVAGRPSKLTFEQWRAMDANVKERN